MLTGRKKKDHFEHELTRGDDWQEGRKRKKTKQREEETQNHREGKTRKKDEGGKSLKIRRKERNAGQEAMPGGVD